MNVTANSKRLRIQARALTAAECEQKAREADARADQMIGSRDRAWERRQAAEWRRLAEERT